MTYYVLVEIKGAENPMIGASELNDRAREVARRLDPRQFTKAHVVSRGGQGHNLVKPMWAHEVKVK